LCGKPYLVKQAYENYSIDKYSSKFLPSHDGDIVYNTYEEFFAKEFIKKVGDDAVILLDEIDQLTDEKYYSTS